MERKGNQFPSLGICQRLFNFIVDSIVSRGLKRITLGPPKAYGFVDIPITGSTGAYSVTDSSSENSPSSIVAAADGPPIMGGTQTQLQKDVQVGIGTGTSSLKTISLEGQQSKQNMNNGSAEVVTPTATDSEVKVPKKIVSFRDDVEVRVMSKGKEKRTSKEKSTQASEPDKGGKGDPPKPVRSILRVASNINEKSDAFIRSRKEALSRSNSSPDPKGSS